MTRTRIVRPLIGLAAGVALVALGDAAAQQLPGAPPRERPRIDAPACRAVLGGTVTEEIGNLLHGPPREVGVPRIQVQLLDRDGERVSQTRTDRNGRFAFARVCEGTYTVCPGTPCPTGGALPSRYDPATREVRVPPRGLTGVDFRFLPPPPVKQPDPGRR